MDRKVKSPNKSNIKIAANGIKIAEVNKTKELTAAATELNRKSDMAIKRTILLQGLC
jgi:hypothetical protein